MNALEEQLRQQLKDAELWRAIESHNLTRIAELLGRATADLKADNDRAQARNDEKRAEAIALIDSWLAEDCSAADQAEDLRKTMAGLGEYAEERRLDDIERANACNRER